MFKKVIESLMYSNALISFGAFSSYCSGVFLIKGEWDAHDLIVAVLVFFGTVLSYNISRRDSLSKLDQNTPERIAWMGRHSRFVHQVNILSFVVILSIAPTLKVWTLFCLLFLGVVSLSYSLPMTIFYGRSKSIREVGVLKIFLIAFVWSSIFIVLPQLELGQNLENFFHHWIAQFLFIFAITLPFDIRDIATDKIGDIKTIPHYIGVRGSRILATCALIVATFLVDQFSLFFLLVLPLIWLNSNKEWFYLGILDSTIILQLLYLWWS